MPPDDVLLSDSRLLLELARRESRGSEAYLCCTCRIQDRLNIRANESAYDVVGLAHLHSFLLISSLVEVNVRFPVTVK